MERCVGHSGPLPAVPGRVYVAAADLGVKNDPSVAVIMHAERREGQVVRVVDRLQRWVPSRGRPVDLGDVQGWLVEMHRQYRPVRVDVETPQAFKLLSDLRAKGVPVREFAPSMQAMSRLALEVFDALRDATVDLPDDPALIAELQQIRLVASGGAAERYRLDHASGKHNDQGVALGIALLALAEMKSVRASVSSAAGRRIPPPSIVRTGGPDASFAGGSGRGGEAPRPMPARSRQARIMRMQGLGRVPPGAFRPPREGPQQ